MPLFDGAGVIVCGDDEPMPVVLLGGVTVREAVVVGLFAELLLLFHPAKIRKPISSSIETPATQLHIPPTFSSRPLKSDLLFALFTHSLRGSYFCHAPQSGP